MPSKMAFLSLVVSVALLGPGPTPVPRGPHPLRPFNEPGEVGRLARELAAQLGPAPAYADKDKQTKEETPADKKRRADLDQQYIDRERARCGKDCDKAGLDFAQDQVDNRRKAADAEEKDQKRQGKTKSRKDSE